MNTSYLSDKSLEPFLKFHFPEDTLSQHQDRSKSFQERIKSQERLWDDYVIITNDLGQVIWSFNIFSEGEGSFGIQTPKYLQELKISDRIWSKALTLIDARLNQFKAKKALLRFTKGLITSEFPKSLLAFGFKKATDRVEFRKPLKELPSEDGTPLKWKSVGSELTLEFAASIMSKSSQGDRGAEPGADALEYLKTDLQDDVLYCGLDSIQVGYLNDEPAAFIFAQVNKDSGWSRITYMGLLPEFRGQALSKWLHRHGFEMMRAQGGTEYFGGTSSENKAMLAVFRMHQCNEYRVMEDWTKRF